MRGVQRNSLRRGEELGGGCSGGGDDDGRPVRPRATTNTRPPTTTKSSQQAPSRRPAWYTFSVSAGGFVCTTVLHHSPGETFLG